MLGVDTLERAFRLFPTAASRTLSLRERVEAIVTRVQRAALAAKGKRSDEAIDAMLLAALVTAGADEIRQKLEEHEDGARAV